jgi:uncharacterized protein YndB with AHSA1/START domain
VAHTGEYLELARPRRIVFTLSVPKYDQEGDRVTIEIAPDGPRCVLTLTHELRPNRFASQRQIEVGWAAILAECALEIDRELLQARVVRRFEASAEQVFDAWLDPFMLGRWMFGPDVRDEQIVRLSLEPWVGGRFSFVVRRQDQEIDHIGRYLELDRPRRLVFTWAVAPNPIDGSRVTVEIRPRARGCELMLVHRMEPEWREYVSRTLEGWTHMLGTLERALGSSERG